MAPVIEADALGIYFKRNRRRHKRLRDMFSADPPPVTKAGKPGKKKSNKAAKFWALRDISFQVTRARPWGWSAATGRASRPCSS